ncbi:MULTISPECIES: cation:proton antiporter, partial [unclassified Roseibium]|uniref:cation:proton antiporter n=1 Tax=unclassified Roseibium TaxID=2629323 RepID=UPI00273D8AEE
MLGLDKAYQMQFDQLLVTLGVVFLAGLAADQLGRMTRFPRVTMLILLGVMAGNTGFGLLPNYIANWFDELAVIALTMVAFLLGNSLTKNTLAQHGRAILAISLSIVVCTLVIVSFGLTAIGLPIGLSVLLAALATATDPAAVADVVRQSGLRGGFVDSIKGIVAIDDAWGLIFFSFALVLVSHANGWPDFIARASWDLGGAAMLGCVIGFPSAFLTGRLKPGEPMQAEAIGIVFLTAGLALLLEVSFLITGMTVGAIIANFARHHDRPFYEIEHIQWPFMILFFLLAGATLEFEA